MQSIVNIIKVTEPNSTFRLEAGNELKEVEIAYTTYGTLNAEGTNAVLVCHALSGDSHVAGELKLTDELIKQAPFYKAMKNNQPGWWDSLIGKRKPLDTDKYFVICSNILGSCYGSTGPTSINPDTGEMYRMSFPQVTVRDIVRSQKLMLDKLGVKKLVTIIGGSLGGMQALEWSIMYPDMVESIIPIATSAKHSAWAIGFNHIGRSAIMNDPNWNDGYYNEVKLSGLSIARMIGMISYRTQPSFEERFGRDRINGKNYFDDKNLFQSESYLNYQGKKLVNRFDPNSYIIISRILDLHDVSYNRGSIEQVLRSIKAKTLCIGIDTDILYPPEEQKEIQRHIPGSLYAEIKSIHGHDGFLIEFDQMKSIITNFIDKL